MKISRHNPFSGLQPSASLLPRAVLSLVFVGFAACAPSAFAAALTWDTDSGTAGAQDGGGVWANGAGNWLNTTLAAENQNWINADSAVFGAGTDGTYAVSLSGTVVAPGGVTFNNSGYTLSGSALSLVAGAANSNISVAAGQTATIESALTYVNNIAATITANGTLNLAGGLTAGPKPQLSFGGIGTINITAGTYAETVANWAAATMNQSGGAASFGAGNNTGLHLGRNGVNDQTYTISGGTFSVNSSADTSTGNFLGLGRNMGNFTAKLVVKTAGIVNVGTTAGRSGQISLGTGDGNGNSMLDVQAGGTVTVGTGQANNKIYFFNAAAGAGKTATMTQSGGLVTTNGIQFGNLAGTYDGTAAARLALSGGDLYVGAGGIKKSVNAAALTDIRIELTGGRLGATADWTSDMAMKLGAAGVEIKAADSLDVARNITLSGVISDVDSLGKLTKTGGGVLTLDNANTYTGATVIEGGTLALGANGSLDSSAIMVGAGATFDVSAVTGGYTLESGQTISGTGTVAGAMNVTGTLSPGNSPGVMTSASQTWSNGGDYNWQMHDAVGAAGSGFDQIQIAGTLNLTNLTAGGFDINLWSLASVGPDLDGNALNLAINQSWNILTASGGILGFETGDFKLNTNPNNGTAGFSNTLAPGASFQLGAIGNNLVLTYIPEPNVAALLGVLGLLSLGRRRRN